MSVAGVARGALLCALTAACGQRAGDPVVTLAETPAQGGESGGGDHDFGGAHDFGDGYDSRFGDPTPIVAADGPVGLCGACDNSSECGDANDACIRHDSERFCGRDCDEQHPCPDGYSCVELDSNQLLQCVPDQGCPDPAPTPALPDVRSYLLARINAERASHERAPLEASSCLDELAQASALDFAQSDEPLGKYVKECDPIWPSCACGWNAEAELSIARYGLDWTSAIERALTQSRDSQNDRFRQAFLSSDVTDVGLGFWLSGDEAWLALSFH